MSEKIITATELIRQIDAKIISCYCKLIMLDAKDPDRVIDLAIKLQDAFAIEEKPDPSSPRLELL